MNCKLIPITLILFMAACTPAQSIPTQTPIPQSDAPTVTITLAPSAISTTEPTSTSTVEPTLIPTDEPTQVPTVRPICNTNLENWHTYPITPNLIKHIQSGEIAKLLHEQHVFENLMKAKRVEHPFNKEIMVKPDWNKDDKKRFAGPLIFNIDISEIRAIENNPERRNLWPVCGFLTREKGMDIIIWAQAVPSKEMSDGYAYMFIAEGTPEMITDPNIYRAREQELSKYLTILMKPTGGYFGVYFNWKVRMSVEDARKQSPINPKIATEPETLDRIGYNINDDAAITIWGDTGFAPKTIETIIRTGFIEYW